MANARRLPSGSWRCQVFAGYEIRDGKKVKLRESFTAPTKREAEAQAAAWNLERESRASNLTVGQGY